MRSGIAVRVAATLLALSFSGCEFTSPTESNPNAVPTASVDQLFTGIQVNSFLVAEGPLSRLAAVWTQQVAGTDRQFSTLDRYVLTEEDASGEFSAIYTGGGLVDLKNAIGAGRGGIPIRLRRHSQDPPSVHVRDGRQFVGGYSVQRGGRP